MRGQAAPCCPATETMYPLEHNAKGLQRRLQLLLPLARRLLNCLLALGGSSCLSCSRAAAPTSQESSPELQRFAARKVGAGAVRASHALPPFARPHARMLHAACTQALLSSTCLPAPPPAPPRCRACAALPGPGRAERSTWPCRRSPCMKGDSAGSGSGSSEAPINEACAA